ncbi:hypothetical protein EPN87_03090 [archaeon]|nr:MAG: hypothetical protein EPN87_03090 [archaeon]
MKGQMSYEFYFALSIFVIFTAYIIFQIMVISPNYVTQVQSQNIKLDAFRVSELLVDDNGYPINWDANPSLAKRVGLSDETKNITNMMSVSKVTAFGTLCSSNYNSLKQLLGLGTNTQFLVTISNIVNNQNMVTCAPSQVISRNTETAVITRIAALNDGTYANITVAVW